MFLFGIKIWGIREEIVKAESFKGLTEKG